MADRLLPNVFGGLDIGEPFDIDRKGDADHWQTTIWYRTKRSPQDVLALVKAAYETAYAKDGLWATGSFRATSAGPTAANMRFDDRAGHHWTGALSVEPVKDEAGQAAIRIAIRRVV
jgi:hypothetical protein